MTVYHPQVTGGANLDLEMSLAEGAGLRGGYSTPDTLAARYYGTEDTHVMDYSWILLRTILHDEIKK